MGGRWDATNVAPRRRGGPRARSAWTTSACSARRSPRSPAEKAGIIKEGRTAVVREQAARGAWRSSSARAARWGRPSCWRAATSACEPRAPRGGRRPGVLGRAAPTADYEELFLPLLRRQRRARTLRAAIVAVEALLGRALDDGGGPAGARRGHGSPGRMEVVGRRARSWSWTARTTRTRRGRSSARCGEAFAWSRLHLVMAHVRGQGHRGRAGSATLATMADRASAYAARTRSPRCGRRPSGSPPRSCGRGLADVATFDAVAEAVAAARAAAARGRPHPGDGLFLYCGRRAAAVRGRVRPRARSEDGAA